MPRSVSQLISSQAEGRTETPQARKMLAPTGHRAGQRRIAMKKGHQARSKKPRRRTFGSPLVVLREGARLRFRVVAIFRVIPEHPTGLTDDDAMTTTRNTKPASYAPARPIPRVRRVRDGHGGAVALFLAVGRVAFASCATPRDAGISLNDSDAASWWFVCRCVGICDAPRDTGLILSGSSSSLRNKRPGLSRRPPCKGVAIGVARRGARRSSGERTLRIPPSCSAPVSHAGGPHVVSLVVGRPCVRVRACVRAWRNALAGAGALAWGHRAMCCKQEEKRPA